MQGVCGTSKGKAGSEGSSFSVYTPVLDYKGGGVGEGCAVCGD